jgi:two-component system sensor histidine kinase QseC
MKHLSTRGLLIMVLVAVVSTVSLLAAALSYREGRIEVDELFDAKLAHSARVLSALVDPSLARGETTPGDPLVIEVWHSAAHGEGGELVSAGGHAYETKLAFQVRDGAGRLLLRSDSGPLEQLVPLAAGFSSARIGREKWRVFILRSPHGYWVQAAERSDIRGELATDIARGTMAPMLLALPVLALLVWVVVAWAARSLARVSNQVELRAADSLQPLALDRVPEELRGLVQAIDGLLSRLRDALARERRFTADAAHEMKTPLAALRVHAANLRTSTSLDERRHSQAQMEEGIGRMDRLVSQLLELEHQEAGSGAPISALEVDLVASAQHELDELTATGLGHEVQVELVGSDSVRVEGDALGLSVLLRNLIDNALRYTPAGGRVRIRLDDVGEGGELCIDDSGPGIAEDARARAFERFHRGLGHVASGSGLGLSIALRVVERHHGSLTLATSPWGGLRALLRLPRKFTGV